MQMPHVEQKKINNNNKKKNQKTKKIGVQMPSLRDKNKIAFSPKEAKDLKFGKIISKNVTLLRH